MLWEKVHARVTLTLIICIALLVSGGVSQVMGETLVAEMEFLKVSEPEFMEVTEFEFMEVSEPEFLKVSTPEFLKVSEPVFLVPGIFLRGKYTHVKRENVAYLRCANLKEFSILHECAHESLGMTQEEVDKAVGEYNTALEEGTRQWE